MNKLVIPSLLLGVVMIAGAFAFMPVQEASTVHLTATTILGTDGVGINSITAGAIGAGDIIANAIDSTALNADAATEIKDAIALIDTTTVYTFSIGENNLAETALTLKSLNAYAGSVTIIAGPTGDALADVCDATFDVRADNDNTTGSDESVVAVSPSATTVSATAAITSGADQLFIVSTLVGATDACLVTVIVNLTSSVT